MALIRNFGSVQAMVDQVGISRANKGQGPGEDRGGGSLGMALIRDFWGSVQANMDKV